MATGKGFTEGKGYTVVGDSSSYPSYVTVTPSNVIPFVWSGSTPDPRALQKASNPSYRVAATWYNTSPFLIDLMFNDTAQHQVGIYCLDWDGQGTWTQVV